MHDILSNSLPNFMHFENLGSYGSQLAIVLGIALFFGTLGGHFFQKLHVPQVVGYFIIGIIIGKILASAYGRTAGQKGVQSRFQHDQSQSQTKQRLGCLGYVPIGLD